MKIFEKVLNFRHALNYGYYTDLNRAVLAITFDEAMETWWELKVDRRRNLVTPLQPFDLYSDLQIMEVPRDPDFPQPKPGQIWGYICGIRIYVEEIP